MIVGVLLGALGIWLIVTGAVGLAAASAGAGAGAMAFIAPAMLVAAGLAVLGVYYWALWSPSAIHKHLENIFSIPELLKKLVFTLVLLCIYRIGFHIPLPGLNQEEIASWMNRGEGSPFGEAVAYFNMFTGGNLRQSTLFGLGIMPYISASIIFQLLITVVPALERLQKEGPAGHKKIQEYTRYAAVLLCLIQATFWMKFMMDPAKKLVYPSVRGEFPAMIFLMGVFGLTAGTIFLMWLGEQIDEYGIGNGISLLIMAGIVTRLPDAIGTLAKQFEPSLLTPTGSQKLGAIHVIFLAGAFVFVVAGAILITQAQRRIPIHQAKHVRGRRMTAGGRHYMPLRVNHGGVMPIIFASSLMIFPGVVFSWMAKRWGGYWLNSISNAFRSGHYVYTVFYVGLIFFFAFFWTTVQFRPKEMAEQLRDYGSFIPGLRPGKRTADYLERVMERITYCGAAFLSVVAVLPMVIAAALNIDFKISAFLGGTGLLIVVSVALDLVQRIESNLVMRNYGGFLGGSSRIKGAYS